MSTPEVPPAPEARRGVSLGRFLGVPVRVSTSWFLVALLITVGFEPIVEVYLEGLGAWSYAVSFAFAVLLYISVFLHEVSHAVTANAFGLPVRGITLHFLGGYTEIERTAPTPGRDIVISAAGPVVSLLLGGLGVLGFGLVTAPVASFLMLEVAVANLAVGVFNLLPALPLDGGHVLRAAVWRVTKDEYRGTVVAARSGQVLAVVVLAVPFVWARGIPTLLPLVWAGVLATVLWTGASNALQIGRLRQRLPGITVRSLTRPALGLPADTSLAEAHRLLSSAQASAIVVVDGGGAPAGLVNHSSAAAVPAERGPWVTVGESARALEDALFMPADRSGEELLAHIRAAPASEYLVVEDDGRVLGVLRTADVDAALRSRATPG